MIAGLVNNDFELSKKLTHRPSDGMVPRAERTDVGGPLAVDGVERYSLLVRAPGQILRNMNTPNLNQLKIALQTRKHIQTNTKTPYKTKDQQRTKGYIKNLNLPPRKPKHERVHHGSRAIQISGTFHSLSLLELIFSFNNSNRFW